MRSTLFSSGALPLVTLFVLRTSASPHLLNSRAVAVVSGWNYDGCYTEATNSRALTGNAYFDDFMTAEKCAAACDGYAWFGVEYGRECYCGNVIQAASVVTDASECSVSCPGNSAESCGAGNRLNMYRKTVAPVISTSSFSALGCWTEGTNNGRTLAEKTYANDSMTTEMCASTCAGYEYFGTEYHRECYCGNTLLDGSTSAPSTDCQYACIGDPSEQCGGDWRLNLYQFAVSSPSSPSSTLSTSLSTASPSSTSQPAAQYTSEGCYTEATGQRALSGGSYYDDVMTVPKCAAVCSGYTWFGLEYGRECYCGNTINAGSASTDSSQCNVLCPGDQTTFCGAGNRLNIYQYGIGTASAVVSSTTSVSSSLSMTASSLTTSTITSQTLSSVVASASFSSSSMVSASQSSVPLLSSSTTTASSSSSGVLSPTVSSSLQSTTSTVSSQSTPSQSSTSSVSSQSSSSSKTTSSSMISQSSTSSDSQSSSSFQSTSSTMSSLSSSSSSQITSSLPISSSSYSSSVGSVSYSSATTSSRSVSPSSSSQAMSTFASTSQSSSTISTFVISTSPSSTSSSSSTSTASSTSQSSSTISSFVTSTSSTWTSSLSSTSTSSAPACKVTTNPIQNGGFENSPDSSWTFSNSGIGTGTYSSTKAGIAAHSGSGKGRVQLSFNTAVVNVYQTITVCPGFTYNFSGWARRLSNIGGLTCQVAYQANGNVLASSAFSVMPGQALSWTQSTGTLKSDSATVQIVMTVSCPLSLGLSTTLGMYLDDVVLLLA